MSTVITSNPEIMHGTPCFDGTRVDVKTFFDHLEGNYSIDEFLEEFPTVRREQVMTLLREVAEAAEQSAAKVVGR